MKKVSILANPTIIVLVCLIVRAESVKKKCFRVELVPTERWDINYARISEDRTELHAGDMHFHLFDGTGNVLLASNANTSQVCLNGNDNDKCYYWFFHGNGYFNVITEDGDNKVNENYDYDVEVIEEVEVYHDQVYYDQPKLIQMGTCRYYCHGDHQQLAYIGLKHDEPKLYKNDNEVNPTAIHPEVHGDYVKKKKEDSEAVMKRACMHPTECYKLVGSALYVITRRDNTMEDEGSTFYSSITFGKCRSHCDNKPLLGSTSRGREILEVAQSISRSEELFDVNSPQYKGACWIVYDDPRKVNADDYNVIQRYVLAVMFYALGGREWTGDLDFMSPKHECRWAKWIRERGGDYGGVRGIKCNELGYISSILLEQFGWNYTT